MNGNANGGYPLQPQPINTSEPHVPAARAPLGTAEKILLPTVLLIAFLFERLLFGAIFRYGSAFHVYMAHGVFWLCYLAALYAYFWQRLKRDWLLWIVSACVVALVVWNFAHPTLHVNENYRIISALVIPGVLMAHAVWMAAGYTLKSAEGMAVSWLAGWFVLPFSKLTVFFYSIGTLFSQRSTPTVKKAMLGVVIAVPMLLVIVPLLMGADQVFAHFVRSVFSNFSVGLFIFRVILIAVVSALFFSFLWNVGYGGHRTFALPAQARVDRVVSYVVLGSISMVYVAFCIVQFTFLFARAGLPQGMTYAEYARQGFAQTVAVCAINLIIFAIFLRLGEKGRTLKVLLLGLLTLTAIMLISGATRLHLYIATYGLTWLRLLSAWFMVYVATVIGLCAVRLLSKRNLPVLAIGALILLVWFVILGWLNPDAFVAWYNG
ncbi:MAG: DUF4173 domain-containing protein [Defluviitaleaceae bacterium]|nr:DUF4173 domain-containing protein [Defluviitaleaceae bacterium]